MYLRMGWRNIWRNPRRTAVVMTAIIIGVWAMVFMSALMRGIADQLMRDGIAVLTGHIQIHAPFYRDDPVIENSINDPAELYRVLAASLPTGAQFCSRVRVYAIASNARHAAGVTFVGIVPEQEAKISFLGKAITEGRPLVTGDAYDIIVGKALADQFETRLGKKLVIMTQDKEHEIASRAFRIAGVFRAETEAMEKSFVFVDIGAAREMMKLGSGISEVSILLPDHGGAEATALALRSVLPSSSYEVNTWQELLPFVTAIMKIYDRFIFIWYFIIFIAMGFGIVNTTLMAVFERIREFGLFKALGMKPWWIVRSVLIESFFLLLLGIAAGNCLGYLSVYALSGSGIDLSAFARGMEWAQIPHILYPAIHLRDVVTADLVVIVLGLAVSVYPAVKAARFVPVKAMAWN